MIINSKILSLPPFISTEWGNVKSLHWDRGTDLVVTLFDGSKVVIPQLPVLLIHQIFHAHSEYLERDLLARSHEQKKQSNSMQAVNGSTNELIIDDMKLGEMGVIDAPFEHNPEHANFPDLPESLLNKMSKLLQVIGLEQFDSMPEAEPHCNCLFCQVSRTVESLRNAPANEKEEANHSIQFSDEEIVTDEDLRFKEWDITQIDDKRYQVTNPLDPQETFQVYLDDPVGCTCGHPHCQHIRAVLKS